MILVSFSEGEVEYFVVESSLPHEQIEGLFSTAETAEETTQVQAFMDAVTGFNGLPNWATWTPAEAATNIMGSILNGWDQAQADAWVDQNVTSWAGARAAFKQVTASIISIRSILVAMAKAVLFLRDYIIKLRR